MIYREKRKESECKGCSLDGAVRHKCFGVCDIEKPEIAFIGEAPGADEDESGIPFVGVSGMMLKKAVGVVGKAWHRAHKTNVIICRPPKNDIDCDEALSGIKHCRKGFIEELRSLKKKGVSVLVAVGATAMKALSITGTIGDNRGSVFMLSLTDNDICVIEKGEFDFVCVPTFHPSFLLRGQSKHEVTFVNDIDKAYQLTERKYKPPREKFLLFPTIEDIKKKTEECLKRKDLLAVDIETCGGFVPGKARIIMVGIGIDEEEAFCIPFLKQGGGNAWDTKEERMMAHQCLKRLMENCPTMFHNGLYDVRHLEAFGAKPKIVSLDTMILAHDLSPELPQNLGYVVSIYGKTPYWKDVDKKRIIDLPDGEARLYNARDCVTLHQIKKTMLKDAKESGVLDIFENISMPLFFPVYDMIQNGVLLDKKALASWKRLLKIKLAKVESKLREIGKLPEGFNLSSGDHMRALLYGNLGSQYSNAKSKLEEMNEKGVKKTLKKYQNEKNKVNLFESIVPFKKMYNTIKKTEKGSLSVDEEAMLGLQMSATNRMAAIEEMKKPTSSHIEEKVECERLISFVSTYREYAETEKLLSTYTSYPVNDEGRVQFPYRTTGTSTGRLSSGNKEWGEAGNAQNIPPEAKKIFIARPGYSLINCDYKALELRVLAYVSGDDVLEDVFKKGLDPHGENCKALFGLNEDSPLWKPARKVCKTMIFGRNYGGSVGGIFKRVAKEVPELHLTFSKFCEVDSNYRKLHPQYMRWYEKTKASVLKTRMSKNDFGRVRYFLGTEEEIVREGLNTPIQGTAADVINTAMIKLWKSGLTNGKKGCFLVMNVHDALVFEVREDLVMTIAKKVKSIMEAKVKIKGRMVGFPVDAEIGKSLGVVEKLEIK
jgi:uracil-DNA glycosylase family 4